MRPAASSSARCARRSASTCCVALNSGVPGMCTVHANSAREAVTKLCTLPLLAGTNVTSAFVVPTVAASVDLVVHAATDAGRTAAGARDRRRPGRVEGDVVETAAVRDARRRARARRRVPAAPGAFRPRRVRPRRAARRRRPAAADGRASWASCSGWACCWSAGRSSRPTGWAVAAAAAGSGSRCSAAGRGRTGHGSPRRRCSPGAPAPAVVAFVLLVGVSRSRRWSPRLRAAWRRTAPVGRRAVAGRAAGELLASAWPDVVDDLDVRRARRAGAARGARRSSATAGRRELRPAFAAFAADYRATGRFADGLDRLKDELADPVGDRVVESLRVAREVGGSDLGRLLRTLSAFLREDARTRGELRGAAGLDGQRRAARRRGAVARARAARTASAGGRRVRHAGGRRRARAPGARALRRSRTW